MFDSTLLAKVYGVLDDPRGWNSFLEQLCLTVDTSQALLLITNRSKPMHSVLATHNLDAGSLAEYRDRWGWQDPWMANYDPLVHGLGTAVASETLCPDFELEQQEIYQQFLKPRGFHYGAGVVLEHSHEQDVMLTVARPKAAGPLSAEALLLLEAVAPHLRQVIRLVQSRSELLEERNLLRTLFDRTDTAAMLLNRRGVILLSNIRAEGALHARVHLQRLNNQLSTTDPAANRQLQSFFSAIQQPEMRQITDLALLVNGTLRMMLTPIRSNPTLAPEPAPSPSWEAPAVSVIAFDPSLPAQLDVAALRHLFALTKAECDVVSLLAAGRLTTDLARELHISMHTVRSHIKSIFAKTATKKQSELVSMVLRAFSNSWKADDGAEEKAPR